MNDLNLTFWWSSAAGQVIGGEHPSEDAARKWMAAHIAELRRYRPDEAIRLVNRDPALFMCHPDIRVEVDPELLTTLDDSGLL
jgi:hypothetical protein